MAIYVINAQQTVREGRGDKTRRAPQPTRYERDSVIVGNEYEKNPLSGRLFCLESYE